ncbi:MAG: hypothetical protein AB1861_01395 [Cyanobacteriota bacterium]
MLAKSSNWARSLLNKFERKRMSRANQFPGNQLPTKGIFVAENSGLVIRN